MRPPSAAPVAPEADRKGKGKGRKGKGKQKKQTQKKRKSTADGEDEPAAKKPKHVVLRRRGELIYNQPAAWHLERVYDEQRGEVVEVPLCQNCYLALPQRERLSLTLRQLVTIVRADFASRRNMTERWHAVRDFLDSSTGVGLSGLLK